MPDEPGLSHPILTVTENAPSADPPWLKIWFGVVIAMIVALASIVLAGTVLITAAVHDSRADEKLDQLQHDLDAERAEDDTELRQSRCDDAFGRRTAQAFERVTSAESDALVALNGGDPQRIAHTTSAFVAAADRYADAVAARETYASSGYPLPCPI